MTNAPCVSLANEVGQHDIGTERYANEEVDEKVDKKRIGANGRHRLAGGEPTYHRHVDGDKQLLEDTAQREWYRVS